MPSGRQRQTQIRQRQKRRIKNKGGKAAYALWEGQIRGAQKRKGIPPGKEFDKDVKQYYEIKNLSTIERMFRQRVKEMRTRDRRFLGKSALAILSVIRLHSEPTYFHNLRVGLLASALLEGEGRDPTLGFYGGALHDTGKALTEHSLLTGRDINADEYARIKAHAKDGFDLLRDHFKFCSAMAGMHHNEHSSGYGIEPKEMGLELSHQSERLLHDVSVVIALADFVDAAMSRKAMVIKDPKLQGKPLRTMLTMAYPSQRDRIQRILASPLISLFYSRKPE
ncbi:MAG: HD domain-containing protein [Candidatus Iainarchaeum archaeon]|uniref:HD domain-containing protein n=1 Tax=Candidatus Iainarchaeum sp. TaxID=3101447 RepID=A0A7T9DJ35_9ARCH|nr:MAG: HD domain-containing protein [Candidatus Diapherotrites archaeon]